MYRVTAVHVSPDALQAGAVLERTELGPVAREQLIALLETFTRIDPDANNEADPHFLVTGRAERFLVRTGQGKLYLYHAGDTVEPYAELTAEEIVNQLDRAGLTQPPFAGETPDPAEPKPSAPHRGIAVAILVAGLALNAYTVYSVFYTETVTEKPAVTLVTDAAELTARKSAVLGSFATGSHAGDRSIVVQPDGRVRFAEIGSKNSLVNNVDTYQLGKRSSKFCLITRDSGVVDIVDEDTLLYFRDTYKRAR